jgi:hypothetical protein
LRAGGTKRLHNASFERNYGKWNPLIPSRLSRFVYGTQNRKELFTDRTVRLKAQFDELTGYEIRLPVRSDVEKVGIQPVFGFRIKLDPHVPFRIACWPGWFRPRSAEFATFAVLSPHGVPPRLFIRGNALITAAAITDRIPLEQN